MAFDTKAWLVEELGFSAEDAEAMLPKFSDRSDKIEKGILRQKEFSRKMNEFDAKVAKTQAEIEATNAKLTQEMADWAELTSAEKAQAGDLREKLDASQERIFKLEQKLTRMAEDSGVDPKTVLPGGEATPPKKEAATSVFDPTPLQQQIGGVTEYMLSLTADLPAIAQEHFELTGERLDTRAFIAGIKNDLKHKKTDNLDPVKRWESQFEIPAKRTERSTKQRNDELEAAREEGRVAARSEAMLPNTRPVGQGTSPVFRTVGQGGSKLQRPQPSDRMAGARAALASGKYRNGIPAAGGR